MLACPRPLVLLCLAAALPLAGCGASDSTFEVKDVRQVKRPGPPAPPGLTDEARLRFSSHMDGEESDPAADPHAGGGEPAGRRWTYATPEGWQELGPASMRDLGWRVSGEGEAECTFAVYQGKAGGLLANVNRWRSQMSLPATTEEGLAALPKGTLLGQAATRIELDGTFVGMGGSGRKEEGWRMLGLVAELPMATAFLKLTGPAALVEAQRAKFEALAASLRMATAAPAPTGSMPPPPTSEPPFAWTVPEGWEVQPARNMRVATFVPKQAPGTEVYVSQFSGSVGGVRANVDRWRGEMGAGPIGDAELEGLPRLSALGVSAVLLTVDGRFGGMSGKPIEKARLLGLIAPRSRDVVFVKMVGPAEEVRGEEERFRAFCSSLHE